MVERVPSGIKGFDSLVEGGFPKGHAILVSGAPGTGKSIFCMQALYHSAREGKRCLYITFEQKQADVINQMKQLGMSWGDLDGNLEVESKLRQEELSINLLIKGVKRKRYDLIAIDSLASIASNPIEPDQMQKWALEEIANSVVPTPLDQENINRIKVKQVITAIKETGATSLLVSETSKDSQWFSRDTISEFLCDGIIVMHAVEGEEGFRTLTIPKIRMTKQRSGIYSFEIGSKGIVVKSEG